MRISDWSSDVCSSDLTAALLEEVYLNGLGEFAYRNGLDLHGRIRFPGSEPSPSTKPALKPSPSREGLGGDGFPPGPTETHPHPGPPRPAQRAGRPPGLRGSGAPAGPTPPLERAGARREG